MFSDLRETLLLRLRRGRKARETFVESHITKSIAFQIRAMREHLGWTQQELAEKIGSNQNAVYRLESTDYGKATLTTLKKVAAAMDVALVVRFVRFGELVDYVSGRPRVETGLNYAALDVPPFEEEMASTTAEVNRPTLRVTSTGGPDSYRLQQDAEEPPPFHYGGGTLIRPMTIATQATVQPQEYRLH